MNLFNGFLNTALIDYWLWFFLCNWNRSRPEVCNI